MQHNAVRKGAPGPPSPCALRRKDLGRQQRGQKERSHQKPALPAPSSWIRLQNCEKQNPVVFTTTSVVLLWQPWKTNTGTES